MDDLRKTVKDSSSSFSSLSVDSDGREISGQDYTELNCFLEDVRDRYEQDFSIRFLDYKGGYDFYIEVINSSVSFDSTGFKHERLLRSILQRTKEQNKCEDYWIDNGRLFLRGDFGNESCEISFYGIELYTIELTNDGSQIREYVPIEVTWEFLREFRFRQIRQELNCLECGSEIDSSESKIVRCQDCGGSTDLNDLSFPLTIPMEDIVSYIEENYTNGS